ncbi:uncharacterized protein LOC105425691 isoform X2 [Pogonomyrmex barbatus]|uniref:Uncharacterized protein LOC105425691 isoform X2 n=1 Tax=Pogonomyrmex barbatus TaxID=144034 RepID=A0A6I9W850_9HYME|nr:uncharacterized protein LOC105425691 isoform X2 [Pogonomyrmex barbatus]
MRIEPPAGMEQRLPNTSGPSRQIPSNNLRKSKRRSNRRNNLLDTILDTWPNDPQNNQEGDLVAGMEYPPRMLWQSTGVQQNVPGNGQRLFTAMSDPSVCGYSPMPMTYAMQPVSLPTMYRMYQPMPVPNIRTVQNRHRHHCNKYLANVRPNANNTIVNGYGNLQENGILESAVHIAHQNGDYASLPPTANKDSGVNSDELNSEHRRYSDPGLGPAEKSSRSDSDDSDSIESGSSITTISRSNKLVLSLIEQMTELKKCNSQLFKELTETKSSLENVKTKLSQCKHNTPTDYQPGMLSELICEIREANRNCEENLGIKIKSMIEEKCNQQAKEVNELKNQLEKFIREKEESDERVAKLEEEVTVLKLSATNEGREIAAFEEETLALRRELQEARASRTLAENHAAKCVNFAVSRSVTPVTFDTPCMTSTPVRTALTDTLSLLSTVPSVISSHTSSAFSVLRSRPAEVAVLQSVLETASQNSGTDSGSVFREDSPRPTGSEGNRCSETSSTSCQIAVTCIGKDDVTNAIGIESWNNIEKPNSKNTDIETLCKKSPKRETLSAVQFDDYLILRDQQEARNVDVKNDDKGKPSAVTDKEKKTKCLMTEEERTTKCLMTDILKESTDDQLAEKYAEVEVPSITERDETKIDFGPLRVLEESKDLFDELLNINNINKSEKLINRSYDDKFWKKLCKFQNQRGSFKKSRRKKENLKEVYDITSKYYTTLSCSSSSNEGNCDTASEDENCYPDNCANRAITEVPDVVVVGGGSIVPKDLCSTRTLTSRTQTAPSRATYTTAYI